MATPSRSTSAGGVAGAHRALAILFAIGALAQFVLAGYAVFGGSSFDAHKTVGDILSALSLIVLILAAVGRREALQSSAILFVLMILQNILGAVGDDAPALGALHPLNGLAIIGAAMSAAAGTSFGPPHGRTATPETGGSRTT
jgi:drug/metabolite transporter (DMT)-like permease